MLKTNMEETNQNRQSSTNSVQDDSDKKQGKSVYSRYAPSISSLKVLKQQAQITTQITKKIAITASDFSSYFSVFLNNSKGKDKFLSVFQYWFQFVCTCCKNSNIQQFAQGYKKKQLRDIAIYYNLKQSISSARKVFRLLRFLDEIKGLRKILISDKPVLFKIISAITYFCSIMYYVSDNTLWLIGILVKSGISNKTTKRNWKYRKNFFSLSRLCFYFIIVFYSIYLQQRDNDRQKKVIVKKIAPNKQFDQYSKKFVLSHITGRRKIRFVYLQLFLSIFRMFMLISSLKLIGHQKLNPIFIGLCGVMSSILGLIKTIYEKKIILNFENKPERNEVYDKQMDLENFTSFPTLKIWLS